MRNSILYSCLLISLSFLGCTKQDETKPLPPSVEEQFMQSSQQINKMLDALENREVALNVKREILCKTYPEVYKNQYMPALLKLSLNVYTKETLLRDYEAVIGFYKKAWSIHCA
ncbi:hypothetical protein OHV35_02050 [Acinetobacter baumannii]|nr:hypothetical protein [Acinetobacter baumannii]